MDQDIPVMIGMPVYNAEKHLPAALDSILNQTYRNFEVVISDNASTDSTPDICADYEKRDSRVRVIHQKVNLGAARNFNFVGKLAGGKYFKWAAGNDICQPQMLEVCVKALEEHPDCVLAYPEAFIMGEDGSITSEFEDTLEASDDDAARRFFSVLSTLHLNNAQSGLIRSDILLRTGFEGVYAAGDIPFMAELALYGKFLRLPERLFQRRVSQESSTIGNDPLTNKEFNQNRGPVIRNHSFLTFWPHLFRVVYTSDLGFPAKARIYLTLLKRIRWELTGTSRKAPGPNEVHAGQTMSLEKTHEL